MGLRQGELAVRNNSNVRQQAEDSLMWQRDRQFYPEILADIKTVVFVLPLPGIWGQ